MIEHSAGYTCYWSGKHQTERRLSGIGFMVKTSIYSKLQGLSPGHLDHIMSLRLPLQAQLHTIIISVYTSTLQVDQAKKSFYLKLRGIIPKSSPKDKIIIMYEFNGRVGHDCQAWKGVLAKHGNGHCGNNRCLLIEVCTEMPLSITITQIQQKDFHKITWMHPRSRH